MNYIRIKDKYINLNHVLYTTLINSTRIELTMIDKSKIIVEDVENTQYIYDFFESHILKPIYFKEMKT